MMAKILVVDDEESIRFTFHSFLSDAGHEVTTAGEYDEALGIISRYEFDLIFMDIVLHGKTGIDLLRELKMRDRYCPVVMITGYPNVETASAALRLGAFDYIFKPVKQEILLHITGMALQNKALRDENEKYRANLEAIFKSVKDAIITVDKDLSVLQANEAAEQICGITHHSLGKSLAEIQTSCNSKCLDVLKKTILEKQPFEVQRTECEYNGRYRQVVTISTWPLINSRGTFSGAVMIVRDDTRLNDLERDLGERRKFHHMIGQNRQMQRIYNLIEDLADVETTVLITGESGTGKELVAEAIHYKGKRSSRPLVKVNCSALSESLLESELFGHVRGAFTGADKDKVGRFQKADGGTIFLDEIGELSPQMQLRLLRVLQDKVFERVGDSTPIKADVRVITATNQDLSRKVSSGELREDLYYRLKVVMIELPPLQQRLEDIPPLAAHFANKAAERFGKKRLVILPEVLDMLASYTYPGNVRELEHIMERAVALNQDGTLRLSDLPPEPSKPPSAPNIIAEESLPLKDLEMDHILEVYRQCGYNQTETARKLGISRTTLWRRMRDLQQKPHKK
ncbi:MAG TPA: sigma-54-dependent Fis family transcriptional regulator [Nitrospiraceae bacterium]|nr:sigma-54-dependent Fis family transcriptional regulator [Nitrospiraceae bacterium]